MRWLFLAVLLCGCLSHQVVVEKYVCPDADVVDDPSMCVFEKPQCPVCDNAEAPKPCTGEYVASVNSKLFHTRGCSYSKRIKDENLVCFASLEEGVSSGRNFSGC